MTDAPAAFRRPLKRYLVTATDSLKAVDLRIEASKFHPCLFLVYRKGGLAVGVITTHIDDLLGCGEQDTLRRMEKFLSPRFVPVKVQKDNSTHTGRDVLRKDDGSVEITQKTITALLRPIATSPSLWRDRNRALSDEELQICQGNKGELCWLSTVSSPDICARRACFSANLGGLKVIDIYRINDLIKTVTAFQAIRVAE